MSISKEDQIAYWSSEAFLNQYFYQLKFNEPYPKQREVLQGDGLETHGMEKCKKLYFTLLKIM